MRGSYTEHKRKVGRGISMSPATAEEREAGSKNDDGPLVQE
jgi:hypothetical protein